MATFHLFPQLPTELRFAIWRLCLPRRVLELDYERDDLLFGYPPPCARNMAVTDANTRIPTLSLVNHEARCIALENWQPLPEKQSEADWAAEIGPPRRIDSHCTHFIHLNWAPAGDSGAIFRALGDPLHYAMWVADQIPGSEVSLDVSLLEDVQFNPNNTQYPWTREELQRLMRQRKSFVVMVVEPIFVHGDFYSVARTGLFGLLGDAPVQLVYADDHVRLNAFMELGRVEGLRLSSDSVEEGLLDGIKMLTETITVVFGVDNEEHTTRLIPAVMFRYCPYDCASNRRTKK